MIRRILCWLGWHKWGCICGLPYCRANDGGYFKPRKCKCCGKVQR